MIKVPYDSFDLTVAILSLKDEDFTEERVAEWGEFFKKEILENLSPEKAEFNKKIAEFQGITVEQLVNSPNYKIFQEEYMENLVGKIITSLTEKLEITNKQAWALFVHFQGLL